MSPEPTNVENTGTESSRNSASMLASIKTLWSKHIAFEYIAKENILVDHLANERTWHNWLALSNAISWMGVVVAQMSKISKVIEPDHYHMLRYKACICQAVSVVILLIGTCRFYCEQRAINGNGTRASQWSLLGAGALIGLLCCSFFVMLIIADTALLNGS